jgi:hypothetical protein
MNGKEYAQEQSELIAVMMRDDHQNVGWLVARAYDAGKLDQRIESIEMILDKIEPVIERLEQEVKA